MEIKTKIEKTKKGKSKSEGGTGKVTKKGGREGGKEGRERTDTEAKKEE